MSSFLIVIIAKMRINPLVEQFIKYLGEKGRSSFTLVAYKKDIEQMSEFVKNKEIKDLKAEDLKMFLVYLTDTQKFSAKTSSRKLNSIKTFCKYLKAQGILKIDPSITVKHPKLEIKAQRILEVLEYKAIRDTSRENPRIYTIIELLLQTGAKIGEISRLRIEDIKLNANTPKMIIKEFSSNSLRVVELNDVAKKALEKYLRRRKTPSNDKGYLFNTRTGNRVMVRNMRTAIDRIFRKSGVKNVKVNDLRNTFIAFQIENGISLKKIAETVGHKRLSSTERYLKFTTKKIPGKGTKMKEL